nr:immunoglobulin light chain junction region [Macaca mulatta]MOW66132.1 immunoglobulin light chain junction region [Macaca mulatta]MOW66654.1 immunoglobulin light chain junction region [Macaca mulatta]MOW68409.1 immunoglobulin light chain junction region [Macaca mulatta]MOW68920.1 immunoglobulin light chain junction region [Macaca mulatta]
DYYCQSFDNSYWVF